MSYARHRHCGFTLTELLVVISILLLLMGLLGAALMWPRKQRMQLEATQNLQAMATSLLKMKQDLGIEGVLAKNGDGKADAALLDSGEILKELSPTQPDFAPFTPRFNTHKTTYMEFKQHQFKEHSVCDPWGRPFRYIVYVIEANQWPYEVEALYSAGADGKAFNADDVVTVVSRTPVKAKPDDAKVPVMDRAQLAQAAGWIEKPGDWP